ncbi:MAG: NAD-dependent epimerase/dehydratase family protein [bacterium]
MATKPRVLVTGGAGYIGSTLVRDLLENGYAVRALDNLTYGDYGIADLKGRADFEFIQGDIRNTSEIFPAVNGVAAVVHLAGSSGDQSCNLDEDACYATNFVGTEMVVRGCEYYGVPRLAFGSSCSVYGAAGDLVDESCAPNPLTLYARTKLLAEGVMLGSSLRCPTAFRMATVYGISGRSRLDLVLNQLTVKALVDGQMTVFGGGQWRPLVHVKDVSGVYVKWLEADEGLVARQVFNVGADEQNIQIRDLAYLIKQIYPEVKLDVRVMQSDFRDYRVGFSKIRDVLGFHPARSLEDGILEVKHALDSGFITNYKDPKYSTRGRKL